MIRVVHYLNQFFAGIGGENKADVPLAIIDGPVGPGVPLQGQFKSGATIVATMYAGDNYANENKEVFLAAALERLKAIRPDVIVAGPAFNAGRYGLACASLLKSAKKVLDIPGVTGLSPENPAVESYRDSVYVVATSGSAAGMAKVLPTIARLAERLGERIALGPAQEEGYMPTGVRRNTWTGVDVATRAINLALARVKRQPFKSELEIIPFDTVAPPPPILDLSKVTVALITEGGLVPAGNPDHLETQNASTWFHYPLPGGNFRKGEFEAWHGGHITDKTNEDPDRNVPLDAMRSLEKEGVIGKLYEEYFVTCGNSGSIKTMTRMGQEIGAYLREKRVSAAVLTAT
jgi:glycine reductase